MQQIGEVMQPLAVPESEHHTLIFDGPILAFQPKHAHRANRPGRRLTDATTTRPPEALCVPLNRRDKRCHGRDITCPISGPRFLVESSRGWTIGDPPTSRPAT